MAFSHGSKAYLELDNASGSSINITPYLNDASMSKELETAEVTTFGKTAKVYIQGLQDATISAEGDWDPALDAIIGDLAAQATRTFIFGPAGNTSGFIKYTGECIITSYEVSAGVGDALTFSLELQVTDTVTRTTF